MGKYCQIHLTCADKAEANKITEGLLAKHLVACVRQLPVQSRYHWQGKIEGTDEIMLTAQSKIELFDQVEAEVTKLHSYDTFVLEALTLEKISAKAAKWLQRELI